MSVAILDHLGLDHFLTLGRSGGGPHALAFAALLSDRCDGAATIASDRFVPPSHGEWLAAHVSGARSHLHADEGHISLLRQMPRVLDDLANRAGA